MSDLMNNEVREAINDAAETAVEEVKKHRFDPRSFFEGSAATAAVLVVGSYVKKKITAGSDELKKEITEKTAEASLKKLEKQQAKLDAQREALLEKLNNETEEEEEV